MQNVDVYVKLNQSSKKYSDIRKYLKLHEQLMSWTPGEVVLDVGCGPGDVTAHVLQQWLPSDFQWMLGVDVSGNVIKHARSTNANDKLDFMTADIGSDVSIIVDDKRYADGFDKVFSFYVLHWLQDLERGLTNLYSLLKPGGEALVVFPVDRRFQRTFRRVRGRKPWCQYLQNINRPLHPFPATSDPAKEFEEMLSTVGFKVVKCESVDQTSFFESMDSVKALIESLDQDMDCIPEDLKAQYLQDCVEIMEDMKGVCVQTSTVKQTILTCFFKKL